MQVIIYTNMGRTFMFDDVTDFKFYAKGIEFYYVGASTDVKRYANFNNTSMVGYATTESVSSSSR